MTPADRYAAWLSSSTTVLNEGGLLNEALPAPSELEIQARWFSGEFGRTFFSHSGVPVEIVQFGVWNREAGPDFCDAAVSIGGKLPVRGCIELDPDARDWERHGHAANPAYENVVLHLFWKVGKPEFFTRTLGGKSVPQVRLDLARIDRANVNPVPYAKPGRCCAPLAAMAEPKAENLLTAAAHYRLGKKAHRLRQSADIHGESTALFQGVAEALGYNSNKLPFLLLAQRLPLKSLRKRRAAIEASLFGVSGFLTATDLGACLDPVRDYLRIVWENWWPLRGEMANLVLPPRLWKCGGVRPMNHPHRRVGALAELARRWPGALRALASADPPSIRRFFTGLSHPYWDRHYTLTGRISPRPMALVGEERVAGILVNVALPWALGGKFSSFEKLQALPAPDYNLAVKTAALRLFAREARLVPLLKTAVAQQGLLQIYDDFCSQDLSDCIRCKLPEQLRQW